MKTYTKYNFHKYTFCIFNEVTSSEIEHLKLNYVSKSGSSYIFTDEGVYRKSDHWGRAANCKWRLQTNSRNTSRTKIGFAKWEHFHAINEVEKLYYIEVDFAEKTVQYNHKGSSDNNNLHLRNSSDTIKRVKEIRNLFENDKKLQYWETTFLFEDLLKNVVLNLVATDLNLLAIKNALSQ